MWGLFKLREGLSRKFESLTYVGHNAGMSQIASISRRAVLRACVAVPALALGVRSARVSAASTLILLDSDGLQALKLRIDDGDVDLQKAVATLGHDAEDALKLPLQSVTAKTQSPPGGDKRDYLSQAPYFWPDPAKPDGKPYIRRDGKVNPEADAIQDAVAIDAMESATATLALAYYFTGDVRYAERAAEHLRSWFTSSRTGMRPNMNYAQLVPGVDEERPNGVIEAHVLSRVPDWALMLQGARAWTDKDNSALKRWFSAYGRWLTTSANGKAAAKLANNQGTWYWVQLACAALYAGDTAAARKAVNSGVNLIATQVSQDGSQTLELARTRPLAYSIFNLRGMLALATLGERVGIAALCSNSALYIRSAFDYVLRVADDATLRSADADAFKKRDLAEIAIQASEIFGYLPYRKKAAELDAKVRIARVTLTSARAKAACA